MTTTFKGRREDHRLITGQGRFAGDRNLPGQLHGHFLRSDHAHAEIASIDVTAARAAPGVKLVLTGEDIVKAGFGVEPPLVRYPGRGGMKLAEPHRHALAVGRVRHVGQEVAFVVADSPAAAQDAAEKIAIEYRTLPVLVEVDDALAPGAPQLYGEIPGNLAFDFEYGDAAKVDAAFAQAAHVTRLTLESQRLVGNPMEPKACLAVYDRATDTFDLHAPSQGMTLMLGGLSAVLGHPREKIRLHAYDVGGGFGVRSEGYPEYCVALLAAKTLGKPVKWVGTRAETFVSDHHGRAARLIGELALDRDGTFLALRLQWIVNAGRLSLAPGPAHQHAAAGLPRHQPLPDSGAVRPPPAGADEHHADHRLSRRRAAERLVHRRAAGRGGGARDRRRPDRAAAAQPAPQGRVPVPDAAADVEIRQRRPARARRHRARQVRLERLRGPARGGESARQAPRHWPVGVRRAGRRGRQPEGGGRDSLRRVGQRRALHRFRQLGPGPRNGVPGGRRRDSRHRPRENHAARERSRRTAADGRRHHRLALDDGPGRRGRHGGAGGGAQGHRPRGQGAGSRGDRRGILRRRLSREGDRRDDPLRGGRAPLRRHVATPARLARRPAAAALLPGRRARRGSRDRSGDRRGEASHATPRSTIAAGSSTTRCSRARSTAASSRASARRWASTRATIATPGSSSPGRSRITRCPAPTSSPRSACTTTRCRRRAIRWA